MAFIHLIYVSTANFNFKFDDAELDEILESAVRHNTSQDITGMLLYSGGNFMQVLEGEEAAIDETYNRIVLDSRHSQVFLLERNPIEKRTFEKWKMGFRRLGQAEMETHPAYSPFFEHGFNEKKMRPHPGIGMEMLIEFGLGQC
jgi:hypothetical protein